MNDTIFREYDIRGKVGTELPVEDVYQLARAIAYYLKSQDQTLTTIAVGMDGRTHSPVIKDEVVRALIDSGLHVRFIGLCPSPVLYFALHALPVQAGLMVTASHNPKEYNGIKICLGKRVVWGKEIQEIKRLYHACKQIEGQKGSVQEQPLIPEYVNWMVTHFPRLNAMKLPIIIDAGNGAAAAVIPLLVEKMGWQNVTQLCMTVDGTYPNHEADPTVIENMRDVQKELARSDAVVGIGIDGDADRMDPMTKSGVLVPGDKLLALFAQPILKEHPGACIVYDIKSSDGPVERLREWGAHAQVSPSGHANIKVAMHACNSLLGGELSCHFFFADRYFGYDDALYAMLRLLEILVTSGKTLDELLATFPVKETTREIRLACAEADKNNIVAAVKNFFEGKPNVTLLTIDGVRVSFPHGWGIVRASNTQPVISMRFEADTKEQLAHIKKQFREALADYFDAITLEKEFNEQEG